MIADQAEGTIRSVADKHDDKMSRDIVYWSTPSTRPERVREEIFAEMVDLCWIGLLGRSLWRSPTPPRATTALGDSLFQRNGNARRRGTASVSIFLIGTNFSEQAEAITRQCVRYLADETCTRLGVDFSDSGALRGCRKLVERLGVRIMDGLGHIVPGIFESAEWQADRIATRATTQFLFCAF